MTYFLPFSVAFMVSVFLTGYFRRIGIKHGIVSTPRARDIHKKPVPRIGGVAIFLSFLIVLALSLFLIGNQLDFKALKWFGIDTHILAICLGGLLIAGSMLLDDIYGLRAWQKLLLQALSVVVLIASGIGIDVLSNPFGEQINLNSIYIPIFTYHGIVYHFSFWSDLLTLIWIVGMMNVINFVDGVDGLAGGVSFIALITIFLLSIGLNVFQPATATIAIIAAGSVLGFLIWNFPPAKIFMGDCGSMFIGYLIGALSLISGGKLATVFLVLGFPILDGLFVVMGRLRRGENPFNTPDKTHLHHRFLKAGYTPRQAISFIYIISILFAWVALRSTTQNKLIAAMILAIALLAVTFMLNRKALVIIKHKGNNQ